MITDNIKRLAAVGDDLIDAFDDEDMVKASDASFKLLSFYNTQRSLFLGGITPEQRHTAVSQLESIIADCNARITTLNQATLDELQLGMEVPGFKLKEDAERRSWRPDATDELLKHLDAAQLYDMKLKGIPAVEKLLGKAGMKPAARDEIFSRCVEVTKGNPTLVKEK